MYSGGRRDSIHADAGLAMGDLCRSIGLESERRCEVEIRVRRRISEINNAELCPAIVVRAVTRGMQLITYVIVLSSPIGY